MNPPTTPAPAIFRHTRFVKTPVVTDVLQLQTFQRGQWVKLAWCDKPSRFHSFKTNGRSYSVVAFHYPNAAQGFASYCNPKLTEIRPTRLSPRVKTLLKRASQPAILFSR